MYASQLYATHYNRQSHKIDPDEKISHYTACNDVLAN